MPELVFPSVFQMRYGVPVASSMNTSGSSAPPGSVLGEGLTIGWEEMAVKGPIGLDAWDA